MIDQIEPERLRRPSANFHLLNVSILAAVIGIGAGFIAYALYYLIAFFTNLFFYQRLSFQPISPDQNQLGLLVILVPVLGGLIVGLLARYGTPKIRGHGIPEAMEAVLTNHSRIAPRVAIFKPLGRVSEKPTPLSTLALGLANVNVSVLVAFWPTVAGENALESVGGLGRRQPLTTTWSRFNAGPVVSGAPLPATKKRVLLPPVVLALWVIRPFLQAFLLRL